MSDWNEFDEGESVDSLDMTESYDMEPVEDIDVSSTIDSIEPMDEGIDFVDESIEVDNLDEVDSIMDNAEEMPIEFEEDYENVDPIAENLEVEPEMMSDETIQNQILDTPDINESELDISEDVVPDMPDMEEVSEGMDPQNALDNMTQYMYDHNYGMEDYAEYSRDPEWQALNRELQNIDVDADKNIDMDNDKVYSADSTELWESGNAAIENNLEAMRDDLRDRGMEDGPEMEALIANEKVLLQDELSHNIQGDFSTSYDEPSWQKDIETTEPIESIENMSDMLDEQGDAISVMDEVKVPEVNFEYEGEINEGNYEATPNSEIDIIQEDGTVDTTENIQNRIENEVENVEESVQEVYETTPASEEEMLQEDGDIDSVEHTPDRIGNEDVNIEETIQGAYEATPNSEVEIVQEDGTIDTLENIQNRVESTLDDSGEISSDIQENVSVDMLPDELYDLRPSDELNESVENEDLEISALDSMNDYMSSHNYGLEDYETYSKDPEWQALNRELQVANGIDINQNEALDGFDEQVFERSYDDFEQSVLRDNPEFYETGSFYTQGVNARGFEGTCGPTSQANAINKLLESNDLTENKVLDIAVENNLCNLDGPAAGCGGTTTEQFMELYDKVNEQIGDKISTELYEYENVLDANQVADRLEAGDVVNVAVDSSTLWGQTHGIADLLGVRREVISDHWITVTGVNRGDSGDIRGFDIIDSGGGESYVSLDKYNDMCFGTGTRIVKDPTCIVVSKKA